MGIDRIDMEPLHHKDFRKQVLRKKDKVTYAPPEKGEGAASQARLSSQSKARSARGRKSQMGKRSAILGASGDKSARKTLGGQ